MIEIYLFEDDKKSILNHNQEPFRVMIVPTLDIDNKRRIFTVPSADGKELISFYFLEYSHNSSLFCFYKVDEKTTH